MLICTLIILNICFRDSFFNSMEPRTGDGEILSQKVETIRETRRRRKIKIVWGICTRKWRKWMICDTVLQRCTHVFQLLDSCDCKIYLWISCFRIKSSFKMPPKKKSLGEQTRKNKRTPKMWKRICSKFRNGLAENAGTKEEKGQKRK